MKVITNKSEALDAIDHLMNYVNERNIIGYDELLDELWVSISAEILEETEEI